MRYRLQRIGTREEGEPTVNLTPLIDVVFVILIAFILVAPLLEMENVELAEASSASDQVTSLQARSPLAIHVLKDDAILVNRQKVTLGNLVSFLKDYHRHNPAIIPQLFHDKQAHFGTYQSVKNAVEMAGFEQMDLVLSPAVPN